MQKFDEINEINELLYNSMRFRNSQEFIKFIEYLGKLRNYSFYNAMLVHIQNPSVTFFGTPKFLREKFKRIVKPDAKPYIALKPFGPIMIVYDLADTTGDKSVDEVLETLKKIDSNSVKGKIADEVLWEIIHNVEQYNIKIHRKFLEKFFDGYIQSTTNGQMYVALNRSLNNEAMFVTIMHELAHLMLGHLGDFELLTRNKKGELKQNCLIKSRKINKDFAELEAETVSYLISRKCLLTPPSASYLANFIKSEDMIKLLNFDLLIKTTDKITSLFFDKDLFLRILSLNSDKTLFD